MTGICTPFDRSTENGLAPASVTGAKLERAPVKRAPDRVRGHFPQLVPSSLKEPLLDCLRLPTYRLEPGVFKYLPAHLHNGSGRISIADQRFSA